MAGILDLISDWSISKSADVMLVTTPYKEISVKNQGSETAGNLFMVGLGDYDVELGTKKRGRPFNNTKCDLLFARLGAVVKGQKCAFFHKINSKQRDKL